MTRIPLYPQLTLTVVTLVGLTVTLPPQINPLAVSPVFAQTQDTSEAEAERLFQQGIQQVKRGQILEAIKQEIGSIPILRVSSFQRAETIEISLLWRMVFPKWDAPKK